MKFPSPVKLGAGCTRWREKDLRRWEAACSGNAMPELADGPDVYLTDRQVAERYQVARPTVWRWARSEAQAA